MTKEEYISKKLDDTFLLWLRRASLWGSLMFFLLGGLDYLVAPDHFPRLMFYRVCIGGLLLTSYLLLPRIPPGGLYVLAFALVAACAIAIELMILTLGGHESPYYVGIVLLGISVTGFVPASFRFHVVTASTVYLIYLLPILFTEDVAGHPDFIIANAFMVLIFLTMLYMRLLSSRSLAEDLGLRYDLEQYRTNLEQVVAARTGELAGAIEHLQTEIAERQRAEEERQHLQDQLLQMQKMESIGRLAGGIAHDFNNVLTAILSYAELSLMKLPEGDPVQGHLQGIRDASEKAATLTHQLLAFSRKQSLEMRTVDLLSVVESMSDMLRRLLGEDVVLELRSAGATRMVKADVGQIEQVVMNLAVNARDAMPKGGRLTIEIADVVVDGPRPEAGTFPGKGEYVLLSVADTGGGMTRGVQEHIFEPFFTTKEMGRGTGLGLATVYGIVKQHHGHIVVDSEPGRGATFHIYLPAGSRGAPLVRQDPPLVLPRGTETVLMVEDDEPIRSLVQEVLQSQGYRVIATASGEEAMTASDTSTDRIDLLLTDVVLPGLNGRELADALRRKRPDVRVLYMSGYTKDVLTRQGLLEQGEALIHKPLTTGSLAQAVRRALDLAR